MVPGAGRYADVRDLVPRGDGGDRRLGAVSAGHPDGGSTAGDGLLGERHQVIAWPQDYRPDAPRNALVGQVEALRLAAA